MNRKKQKKHDARRIFVWVIAVIVALMMILGALSPLMMR